MTNKHHVVRRKASWGGAAVEFVLCLPILILLAFPVVDIARALQANMILTNIAREGANLASRTGQGPQAIMDALAATAPPLDMLGNGMIHITKILAAERDGVIRHVVASQSRWAAGTYEPAQGIWTCGNDGTSWGSNGECNNLPPPDAAPVAPVMTGDLSSGDVVILVEVFYRLPLLFGSLDLGGVFKAAGVRPDLYAMAVL